MTLICSCDELTLAGNQDGKLLEASRLSSIASIRELLQPYYAELVRLYENELLELSHDYRSGEETYGYASLDAIQATLLYISDRWRIDFRVRWLIDLINPEYCLWDG